MVIAPAASADVGDEVLFKGERDLPRDDDVLTQNVGGFDGFHLIYDENRTQKRTVVHASDGVITVEL